MNSSRIPWHVYLVLLIALIGVSSAGTLLQQIDMIPPILRGAWRLQATSLLLLPLAIYQYAQMEDKVEVKNQLGLMLLSGVFLALHFSTWIASLDYTSLTHSLLFVTTHPLVILVGMAILSRFKEMKPASTMEWIGGIIGVTGAIITLQDGGTIQGDHEVTVFGDLLAFAGGVLVVGYIVCGRIVRKKLPIFVYAFIVTAFGAIIMTIGSAILESQYSEFGTFGWISSEYLAWVLGIALVSGLFGHTGLNYALKYVQPLVISILVTLEPIVGSFIGWMLFDAGVPGLWTWIGGIPLIAGMVLIVYAQSDSENEANSQTQISTGVQ